MSLAESTVAQHLPATHEPPKALERVRFALNATVPPEVIQTFHVSSTGDFLVHVAVEDPERLRSLVLTFLTSDSSVAQAQTHLVFEHQRGHFLQDRP